MLFTVQQATRASRITTEGNIRIILEMRELMRTGHKREVYGETGETLPGSESRASLHRMSSVPGRACSLCGNAVWRHKADEAKC